jgi:hypothetical protein
MFRLNLFLGVQAKHIGMAPVKILVCPLGYNEALPAITEL